MIRSRWTQYHCRPITYGRGWQNFCRLGVVACISVLIATTGPVLAQEAITQTPPVNESAQAEAPPAPNAPATPDKKIVNNPFTPGGVTTAEQTITRKEVTKMIADMESRLRKELSGDINSAEINKLIQNAAGGAGGMGNPVNFIGCVNGVPLYRDDEGSLTLGTKEPEDMKKQRCGS